MGSLFRSEEMLFCQMIIEKDAAFSCVAELGKKSMVQFKDLNENLNNYQRIFVKIIRRFDEMERKLRFLEKQIRKDNISIYDNTFETENNVVSHHEIMQLEQTLNDLERDVIRMNESDYKLKQNYQELKEYEAVLKKTNQFFQWGIDDAAMQEIEQAQEPQYGWQVRLDNEPISYTVGVIAHDKVNSFERILWRACRRTAFLRYSKINEKFEKPDTLEEIEKSVFIVFYNGSRLRSIIDKGYRAKQYYNCPKTMSERQAAIKEVCSNKIDLKTVLNRTKEHRFKVLSAAAINLKAWMKQVRLHKSIYHTLNCFTFDEIGKFFIAECWIPLNNVGDVRIALENGVNKSGSTVKPVLNILQTDETPPTFNKTNKYTKAFQNIVDSYGVSSYLELNPAPLSVVTFPFIFSCMFGDLGHGFLLFLIGLYLVLREENIAARKIRNEMFGLVFDGRYIVFLMGVFSMYTGFLYNDVFSKSVNIFGSSWKSPYEFTELLELVKQEVATKKSFDFDLNPIDSFTHSRGPYFIGLDPVWNLAENKLNFLNSFKMKLSLLIGICQMTFGLMLSLLNHRYFKSNTNIITTFIPQLLILLCLIGYLCLQIVLKWMFFWVEEEYVFGYLYPGSNCAPSILSGMINMFMMKQFDAGFVNMSQPFVDSQNQTHYQTYNSCHLNQWYPGKAFVEKTLLFIVFVSVLIMLFGKPVCIVLAQRKAKKALSDNMSVRINMHTNETEIKNGLQNTTKTDENDNKNTSNETHSDESIGGILIYQVIHTIEYCLGCISHSASYLRLWALSLAHAQLSEVLWEMVFRRALTMFPGYGNSIIIFLIFSFFGFLTVAILVVMEGLSTFLHALRLHWVEFQSKFYSGLGYTFVPFSFYNVLVQSENEELAKT